MVWVLLPFALLVVLAADLRMERREFALFPPWVVAEM